MCILFLWTTVPLTTVRDCLWISCGSPQNALWRKSPRHASTFDSYPHNFVLLPLLLPKPMDRNRYLFLSDKKAHRVLTALWIKKWKSGGKQKFIHSLVKTLLIFCGFPQREGILYPQFCTTMVGEALSLPKLMQLTVSMNIERLRRSGRLRAAPTGAVKTGGWRVARLSTPTELKNFLLVPSQRSPHSQRGSQGCFRTSGVPKGIDKLKMNML